MFAEAFDLARTVIKRLDRIIALLEQLAQEDGNAR